jgi:hypothetical protein
MSNKFGPIAKGLAQSATGWQALKKPGIALTRFGLAAAASAANSGLSGGVQPPGVSQILPKFRMNRRHDKHGIKIMKSTFQKTAGPLGRTSLTLFGACLLAAVRCLCGAQTFVTALPPTGTGSNYITGFELSGSGFYWTESLGVGGAAPSADSVLGSLGQAGSVPAYDVEDNSVHVTGFISDGTNLYYSSGGSLYTKPVGSSASDPAQSLATPAGGQVGALTLFNGRLYLADFTAGVQGGIYSMNTDGTGLQQVAPMPGPLAAQITKLQGYSCIGSNGSRTDCLFALLANGNLGRADLNTGRFSNLVSGQFSNFVSSVTDFAIRDEQSAWGDWASWIYAVAGSIPQQSTNIEGGALWQINALTGRANPIPIPLLSADSPAMVTSVMVDSQSIYITLQPLLGGPVPTNGFSLGPPSIWRQTSPAVPPYAGTYIPGVTVVPWWVHAPVPYWELLGVGTFAGVNLRSDGTSLFVLADQGGSIKGVPLATPALQIPTVGNIAVTNQRGRTTVQVTISGISGETYQLLRSTDLTHWVPVATKVMPGSGGSTGQGGSGTPSSNSITFGDLYPNGGYPNDAVLNAYKAGWFVLASQTQPVGGGPMDDACPCTKVIFTHVDGSTQEYENPNKIGPTEVDLLPSPYETAGPLYQVRMVVATLTTANGGTHDYGRPGNVQSTGPLPDNDEVRASVAAYSDNQIHNAGLTPLGHVTCQIGDFPDGMNAANWNQYTANYPFPTDGTLLRTSEGGLYFFNMYDPDSPGQVTSFDWSCGQQNCFGPNFPVSWCPSCFCPHPIDLDHPASVGPDDALDLVVSLEVLNSGTQSFQWQQNNPLNGDVTSAKTFDDAAQFAGAGAGLVAAMDTAATAAGPIGAVLGIVGTFLTLAGDIGSPAPPPPTPIYKVTPTLIPDPHQPSDVGIDLLRSHFTARQLWDATSTNGEFRLDYDLDWGDPYPYVNLNGTFFDIDWDPSAVPLGRRPHTQLELRITRVVNETDTGAGNQGCNGYYYYTTGGGFSTTLPHGFSQLEPEPKLAVAYPPINHGSSAVACEPGVVDFFSFDQQGAPVHNEHIDSDPSAWRGPGTTLPASVLPATDFVDYNFFLNAPVTAISRIGGFVEVFTRSYGYIQYTSRYIPDGTSDAPWQGWAVAGAVNTDQYGNPFLGPFGAGGGPIAVVSPSPTQLLVFTVASDGSVGMLGYDDANGWDSAPTWLAPPNTTKPFDGTTGGGIAAVARDNNNVDVFVIDNNRMLARAMVSYNGTWVPSLMVELTAPRKYFWNQPAPGSSLAALSLHAYREDVFFIDSSGYVEDAIIAGPNGISAIQDVTQDNSNRDGRTYQANPYAPLAAVARKVNLTGCGNRDNEYMDVFTVATDGAILHNVWNYYPARNWGAAGVERLQTRVTAAGLPNPTGQIGVVSPWPGAVYIAATRPDGSLATVYFQYPVANPGSPVWQYDGP